MSHTIERYVIKHISGSKLNQVEEFDFQKQELSIGRAAGCDIQFDPEREVLVSREHGKIVKDKNNELSFTITDNNSRNGIFVNKARVKGSAKIEPGDLIQLGNNGPSFSFDIYPRPQEMMMATRVVEIPTTIKPTTISEIQDANVVKTEPVKTGLGKQTVERMLVAERKKSYSTMALVIGGIIIVLGGLGFAFKDKLFKKDTIIVNNPPAPRADSAKVSPDKISRENDKKVVQIEFGWQLFDTRTSDELWQEYTPVKDLATGFIRYVPLYIRNADGYIEPYINIKLNTDKGVPIGMTGASGSGFVVSEDGYILTNRHVGAGWHTRWDFFDHSFPGLLVSLDASGREVIDYNSNVTADEVYGWVPANATMLGGVPVAPGTIQGRNTYMNVIFSGTTERRLARLAQPSEDHDVALVKVDIPTPLAKVKMKDSKVEAGQTVTVMGYPGIAPQEIAVRSSKDPFNQQLKAVTAPTPTVTPGSVGRIIPASSMKDLRFSGFGDSYQLTINATGAGNSGGPLFDDEGNVIGIYYAGATDPSGTRISFAVPIKYGLALMGVGKSER